MKKYNIIVLGPSGVGKSTLINSVVGSEIGMSLSNNSSYEGTSGIEVHDCDEYNIRLIDTVGFEPTVAKQKEAVRQVQKWSKDGAKKKNDERALDLVWFCVDGTSRRIFSTYIDNFVKAIKVWKGIPVIVVVTKSYSDLERKENVIAIQDAFEKYSGPDKINLKAIIPVVALPYNIHEDVIVNISGIQELMDRTLEMLPEGYEKRVKIQLQYGLRRKRVSSRGMTMASVAAAIGIAITKLNFSAAKLLEPIERKLIDQIAKQYEVDDDKYIEQIKNKLIDSGTVGAVATKAVTFLKKVPPIRIKGIKIDIARLANAVVAGSIVAGIGESSRFVFEKMYLKDESSDSLEWIDKLLENETSATVLNNIKKIWEKINISKVKDLTPAVILTAIKDVFFSDNKKE